MNRTLHSETCPMKMRNLKTSSLSGLLALGLVCLLSGCPEQANVTVTMKPVEGQAAGDGAAASEGASAVAGYGTLVGKVTYDGDVKALPPLVGDADIKAEDRAVCSAAGIPNEMALVGLGPDEARARNAQERARRFEGGTSLDVPGGLRHVQERAEHLAEARPEYGHCTNAVCIVGRREWTRGVFLDRRAFLVSYDPAQDPAGSALAAQLGAVVPVCGGISLEYYFSRVDNDRYGCGTKLPHNVSGLMGVMNGYEGDLRTGLALQMVEIHEPMRILFVIEDTPQRIESTFQANPIIGEFFHNDWIRVAAVNPVNGNIEVYRSGTWEPLEGDDEPLGRASSSAAWFAGRMDHLGIARIEAVKPS